jgi:hypothetical protein
MKLRIATILAASLLCSAQASALESTAPAGKSADARIDRMTDLVVQAMPFGRMFDMASAGKPTWPMQDNPDAVDATQLACLRSELSTEGYRRNKRAEVADYLAAHRASADDEIQVLENGAALLMGKATLAGAEKGITGKEVDAGQLFSDSTPEQVMAFIGFINAPEYSSLRKLVGMGDAVNLAASAEENEEKGERVGAGLAMKIILQSMSTCKVPMSVLLAPKAKDS